MDAETAKKLVLLNRKFYQTFAIQFSATRMRLQPGVARILEELPDEAHILDLGCGNGELACALAERGFQGSYVGLDSSEPLLDIARNRYAGNFSAEFIRADLTQPTWDTVLEASPNVRKRPPYDYILAFAVLHHLPGTALRTKVLGLVHSLLHTQGKFIHSEWQFLNSPRLRKRIQPWEKIGYSADEVDEQDYLLDWRHGGVGLRYVHHFSHFELEELAASTGFEIVDTFVSDGEGGQLGLYQTWIPA